MAEAQGPILSLADLRKSFGSRVAVGGLSLEVGRGEVFGLLGPNGAGKSTTLSMAVGLIEPDHGSVRIAGAQAGADAGPPTDPAVRARIGIAPQSLAVYEDLTAAENLLFLGRLYKLAGATLRRRVDELLEATGLTDRRDSRVATFSGGMKRRLNLAAALVHDPPLIMLDEPTVGVDPQSRNAIFDFILNLKARGRTVLYTTHYMEEAQRLCDRVGIIDQGRLLALDTVPRLLDAHGGAGVITVERDEGTQRLETTDPLEDLRKILRGAGVRSVHVSRPDLESVFLKLTGRRLRD